MSRRTAGLLVALTLAVVCLAEWANHRKAGVQVEALPKPRPADWRPTTDGEWRHDARDGVPVRGSSR